ncbi:MAG: NAD(P)-dependent oxidoreductase [Nanoarchaeota archaeon]
MKRVLITGLTGRIGKSFLYEYDEKYKDKYNLTVGINRTPLSGYKTVKIDLTNLDYLTKVFSDFDVVINLAGNSDPIASFDSLIEPNLIGTYNVLEAAKRAGIKRVVLASSVHAVRGYTLGESFEMNLMVKPLNYYGATKAFVEAMCHVYAYSYGVSCFAIRIGAYISDEALKVACPTRSNFDYIISQRDFAQLIYRCIVAPDSVKFGILAGTSNNKNLYMDLEETKKLVGYEPIDDGYEMCKLHIVGKI